MDVSLLNELSSQIRKLKLLNNRCIGAIIKYRNPEMRLKTGNALKGWAKRHPDSAESARIKNSHPRLIQVRKNCSRAQIKSNQDHPEFHEKRSKAQINRYLKYGASNNCSSKYNYWFRLNGKLIYLRSSYELGAIQYLESLGYTPSPSKLRIPLNNGVYLPDFEYTDECGILHIVGG